MSATPVSIVAGTGGAGTAVALELSALGHHVVLLDSRLDAAEAAREAVSLAGGSAEAHSIDLLDVEAVTALRSELLTRNGRVDVLVHLVGGWRGSKTLELASVDNWLSLNPPIVGTLAVLTAVFADDIRHSDSGRVFMVTSTAAATPTAGNIAYAAAKSAAEAWMAGVAHFLRDAQAASVVVAVKALLTDQMVAAEPDKQWPGYTHVRVLGEAIARACTVSPGNGSRMDLTTGEYSPS
jgi:NAD(P)-dependent dehydrogenase (short-subunit alcohol dehydrogenase family)